MAETRSAAVDQSVPDDLMSFLKAIQVGRYRRGVRYSQWFLLGLPWFLGQVDRSHAMTLRLSIDDQPDQDQAPVHGAAKAGGCRALPQ
jgi:hypothetical protein